MMPEAVIFRSAMLRSCLLSLALIAASAGCSSKTQAPEQPSREASDQPAAEEADQEVPKERRYDGQGKLLPSDEYVVGVRMPRGAELYRREQLTHIYRLRAPIDKVLAYFGPMMVTGHVERRGKGAVYKRASVRGAEISPTKVDLSVIDVGNGVIRISITELPPPPEHAPSAAETRAAAQRDWRTLD